MPIKLSLLVAVFLAFVLSAHAEESVQPLPTLPTLPALPDVVHKGLVGKALDAVPMDPEERVVLQRTSAVVSGPLTARSLAAWAGLAHPILWVAGLAWGIYSALNIKAPETVAKPGVNPLPNSIEAGSTQLALIHGPLAQE